MGTADVVKAIDESPYETPRRYIGTDSCFESLQHCQAALQDGATGDLRTNL